MNAAELEAIRHRHAAYVAAFNDTAAAREAWCDKVAGTAIDCTGDVPTLLAEVERLHIAEQECADFWDAMDTAHRALGDAMASARQRDQAAAHSALANLVTPICQPEGAPS